MRKLLVTSIVLFSAAGASADLISQFAGFDAVWEVGSSGLQSSYAADTRAGHSVTGALTGNALPTLGPDRVSYPSGGQTPSPGGALGLLFDQGAIGVRSDGDSITIQLATALDPQTGYYYNDAHTWITQGDVFLTVQDGQNVSQYALLTSWARRNGQPVHTDDAFASARRFHLGDHDSAGLEGHLVLLSENSDVALTGGPASYNGGNAPAGLDLRTYAQGGTDVADAGLTHGQLTDAGRTWYVQQWTISADDLSDAAAFDIALHSGATCGNDQIGGLFRVPEPGALLIALAGLALLAARADARQ